MDAGAHERGRQVRARLLIPLAAGLLLPAHAEASTTGRLLVTLEPGVARRPAVTAALIERVRARRSGSQVPQIGLVTVRPRHGRSLRSLAARLRADPRVSAVEVERRLRRRLVPDDPALTQPEPNAMVPAGTPVQWWAARENLFSAWDVSTGEGAVVAVIDTGIADDHPDLIGRIVATVDLDDRAADGAGTEDLQGHGTHVASLACATGGNGIGLVGAGFRCSLLMIKSDLSDSSVAKAITVAADRGAHAINMSFGNDAASKPPRALVRAVDYAYSKGVAMVAAAADSPVTEQGDPASILQPTGTGPDIGAGKGLTVTAADFADARASFAGRGSQISMAAYGSFGPRGGPRGVFGAFPAALTQLETGQVGPPCFCRVTFGGDSRYAYIQGTSMAAPQVAAIAALARRVNPDLGAGDVIRLLKRTARRPAGTGWTPDLGWGILDGGAALNGARAIDRTRPVSRLEAPANASGHSIALRWTGSDSSPPGVVSSGIASYELWRAVDGGRARRIARTAETHLRVHADSGRRYDFFTIAVDHAGNHELRPRRYDATTKVASSPPA